jgi:hypothetical protein
MRSSSPSALCLVLLPLVRSQLGQLVRQGQARVRLRVQGHPQQQGLLVLWQGTCRATLQVVGSKAGVCLPQEQPLQEVQGSKAEPLRNKRTK